MRIADELKLFKKLSQGRVERETLEVEQFQIFICHQLTEIIPIRIDNKRLNERQI